MSSVQSTDQLRPRETLGESSGITEPEQQPGSISVIVPTYNESDNIVPVVDRLQDALQSYDYDIIVVDDDSPDGTWKIARREFRYDDMVEVYRRTDEHGLATAVSFGFERSGKDYCAVIDADLQHPPEEIPRLLSHASGGADIVIGSRYTDFGQIENWPAWRRLVSLVATDLARLALPGIESVSDPLSGFFIVRRDVIEPGLIAPTGYKILLELLVNCRYGRVEEVPYVFTDRDRGESKLTVGEYLDFLKHLVGLRLTQR